MSLTLVLFIYLVQLAIALLLLSGSIWLAARWVASIGIGLRRSMAASTLAFVLNSLLSLPFFLVNRESASTPLRVIVSVFQFVAFFACLRWALRTSVARTFLSILVSLPVYSIGFFAIAMVVRWKLLDPFEVPTASMAPTIIGRHLDLHCADCGLEVAVGSPSETSGRRPPRPPKVSCPGCEATLDTASIPVRTGDKILVDKTMGARRFELMVFRYPKDPDMTYVDRLIGLPGETVEIAQGEVFIDGRLLRKTSLTALDLWIPVNDTRFSPRSQGRKAQGWAPESPGSGWERGLGGWAFRGLDRGQERLIFEGSITDELPYNSLASQAFVQEEPEQVGDIQVECTIESFQGRGTLGFEWERGELRIRAVISAPDQVELRTGEVSASGKLNAPLGGRGLLAFSVRDGQAYLTMDGSLAAELATGPQDLGTTLSSGPKPRDPCRVAILASRSSFTLSRIALRRDLHYRRAGPGKTSSNRMTLGPGEYYVLGDNTARSSDSRYWGAVPAGNFLGVARWIFSPAGRLHAFR